MDEKCRSELIEKILDKIKCILDNSDQKEQKLKFFEECGELFVELTHDTTYDKLLDEFSDLMVMYIQMVMYKGIKADDILKRMNFKADRQVIRLIKAGKIESDDGWFKKDVARYANEKANYNVIDMSDKEDD